MVFVGITGWFLSEFPVYNKNIANAINSNNLSISIYSKLTDKKICETWSWIINQKDILINFQQFSKNELALHLRMIDKTNTLVLDPLSIYLLSELNLIELLKNIFEIRIPHYILDELMDEISFNYNNHINIKQNKSLLFSNNGEICYHEISYEDLRKNITKIEVLKNQIQDNVIGISANYDNNLIEKLKSILHIGSVQTFLNTSCASSIIVCDEFIIRKVFKFEMNIDSINSYSLIHYLKLKGRISNEQFYRCLYKMVAFGYEVIPFTCHVILQSLLDFDWNPNNIYFRTLIQKLKNPNSSHYEVKRIFNQFWELLKIRNLGNDKINEIIKVIKEI